METFDKAGLQAIIFDCYGTLFDQSAIFSNVFSFITKVSGIEKEKLETVFNLNKKIINRHIKHRFFLTQRERYYIIFELTFSNLKIPLQPDDIVNSLMREFANVQIYPEVKHVLNVLSQKYSIGLLANGDNESVFDLVKSNNLEFKVITTSEIAKSYKPNPLIFNTILHELRVNSTNAIMIGDDFEKDIQGALALGIPAIWVNKQTVYLNDFQKKNFVSINNLNELPSLLLDDTKTIQSKSKPLYSRFKKNGNK